MPKLHFLSAAAGFIIAGLLALTTSQASPPPATLNPAAIRIEYMPHPRDMVQIRQGTPFTVPPGKLFVLTGLGTPGVTNDFALLWIDGVVECYVPSSFAATSSNPWPVPSGLSAQPGSVVDVTSGPNSNARAWGYLASQ